MNSPDLEPTSPKRVVKSGPSAAPIIVVIAIAAIAAGVWFWRTRAEPPEQHAVAAAPVKPAAEGPAPLPPLAERDALVRRLVGELSRMPELAKWLGAEDLVRRFVTAVYSVSEGRSPSEQLRGVLPSGSVAAKKARGGKLLMQSKGYDVVVRVLASFDNAASVRVYEQLEPMFDSAYREIAPPKARFRDALGKAIEHLLATPVPEDDVALVKAGPFYAYADAELEHLSRAQKQLLRMGPANARAIQGELSELAQGLGLQVAAH